MSFKVSIDQRARVAAVEVGPFHASVDLDQFAGGLDAQAKRALFLHTVKRVNIEVFSYCNRRCGFCPNRDGSRLKTKTLLPKETFERVVRDLESIGYVNPLFFHLYNEPLADAETLLERMTYAQSCLPKSRLSITSNGDFLDRNLFDRLKTAGCSWLQISVYGPGQGLWDEAYIKARVLAIAERLSFSADLVERPGLEYSLSGTHEGVELTIAGRNLWDTGYDRGGLVPELALGRSSPCLSPLTDVNIDFRGYMLPCCNVYTDKPKHLEYTYGNVIASDIFSVYASVAAQQWKFDLLRFKPGGALCGQCSRGEYPELDTEANRAALEELRRRIDREERGSSIRQATL